MQIETIKLQSRGDARGALAIAEAKKDIPFSIQRVYWIYGTQAGVERGFHAHKSLQQVAIAVSGSCDMVLDDGQSQATVCLDSPEEGVLIPPKIWHYMKNFSTDCVLLVFADAHYDEADYIRDYHDFTKSNNLN